MIYELTLGSKIALYDPHRSTLVWKETNEPIVNLSTDKQSYLPAVATHPDRPTNKSKDAKRIKIQMGFACNFSCSYCSQNNQRPESKENVQSSLKKVDNFLEKLPGWFNGGIDQLGKGVKFEFWGGETLLYWDSVLAMARQLRLKYPNVSMCLFTNGSLITKEMADEAVKLKLHFIVSHDGAQFESFRGKDPLLNLRQSENLKYLFNALNPLGLISFNSTVNPANFSLLAIRDYLAEALGTEKKNIVLTCDIATPYDDAGLEFIAKPEGRQELINKLFGEFLKLYPLDMQIGNTWHIIHDFFSSLENNRPAESLGQKCSMDSAEAIAVDLDGNLLTCQNVTAKGNHKIGHIDEFDQAKLDTAYHWSTRKECIACPVVQLCKGSCMFLTGNLWDSACNQHFTWNLAYLSLAIYLQTNLKLTRITAVNIRNRSEDIIEVLYKEE